MNSHEKKIHELLNNNKELVELYYEYIDSKDENKKIEDYTIEELTQVQFNYQSFVKSFSNREAFWSKKKKKE